MNIKRLPKQLKLGQTYLLINTSTRRERIFEFVKSTEKGFNFLRPEGTEYLFKKHLYPSTAWNHLSGDWFWIPEHIKVIEHEKEITPL
jgi:hypothetical protein